MEIHSFLTYISEVVFTGIYLIFSGEVRTLLHIIYSIKDLEKCQYGPPFFRYNFGLKGMETLGRFFQWERTSSTSCLLSCKPSLIRKGVFSKLERALSQESRCLLIRDIKNFDSAPSLACVPIPFNNHFQNIKTDVQLVINCNRPQLGFSSKHKPSYIIIAQFWIQRGLKIDSKNVYIIQKNYDHISIHFHYIIQTLSFRSNTIV